MSPDANTQTAPPGVLVPSLSASTESLPTRPASRRGAANGDDGGSTGSPPVRPASPRPLPTPIRPGTVGVQDVALVALSALASLCLMWVIFYQLTLLSGALGFLVCWYLGFLVLTWVSTGQVIERQVATDRVVGIVVVSAGLLMVGIVLFIVAWVAYKAPPIWAH